MSETCADVGSMFVEVNCYQCGVVTPSRKSEEDGGGGRELAFMFLPEEYSRTLSSHGAKNSRGLVSLVPYAASLLLNENICCAIFRR